MVIPSSGEQILSIDKRVAILTLSIEKNHKRETY